MSEKEHKEKQQREWLVKFTLTEEQKRELFAGKLERMKQYRRAIHSVKHDTKKIEDWRLKIER